MLRKTKFIKNLFGKPLENICYAIKELIEFMTNLPSLVSSDNKELIDKYEKYNKLNY